MLRLLEVQDAIIEHLKTKIQGIDIDVYPQDGQPKTKHGSGAALVRFESLSAGALEGRQQVVTRSYSVLVVSKSLSGERGAVQIVESVINSLAGVSVGPTDGNQYRIDLTGVDLLGYEAAFWQYMITFTIQDLFVR